MKLYTWRQKTSNTVINVNEDFFLILPDQDLSEPIRRTKLIESRIGANVFLELILVAGYNTEKIKDGIVHAKKWSLD
jgi:hypothetical protein